MDNEVLGDLRYLMNAMERAAMEPNPAEHGYGEKRRAFIAAIADVQRERDALRAECDRLRAALSDRYSAALPLGWECPRCHSMRSPYSTYCGCGPAATINGQRVFLR